MKKKFPPELIAFWKTPGIKASWVNDPEMVNPSACPNCNGAGFFVGTIATGGPFNNPGPPNVVSHWHDGKWWIVVSRTAACPVCQGKPMSDKPFVDKPVTQALKQMTMKMTQERKPAPRYPED